MPALRALRGAFPGHELVLAAPAALRDLVALAGVADRLLEVDGLGPVHWEGAPPDLAVNLHGRGPESHHLLRALQPVRLIAFHCEAADHGGPVWTADEHEVLRWCRLVAEALGVPVDPTDLRLPEPPLPPAVRGAVVVHPGAAYPSRRWPTDRFAAVARWAADAGHDVVVTGSPDEVPLADEVCRLAGLGDRALLAGRTSLGGLAALVAGARLVVCGDTGVAHLATACGTPSVLLFGPMPPALWGPLVPGPHQVLWKGDGIGDPWGATPDPALLAIGVDEVVAASTAVLALSAARPPSRTTPASS